MSVATHLNIDFSEYDARIRTFVPWYEEMIATAGDVLRLIEHPEPTVVDLGIGTGALALQCLHVVPDARLIGIDADRAALEAARVRLSRHDCVEFRFGNFLEAALPACDAIVASIALHHVPTPEAKQAFYGRCRAALRPGGLLVVADFMPARAERLAAQHREAWLAHLQRTYSRAEAEGYLQAWSGEDRYFPLEDELHWLRDAGLSADVVWRADGFAVIVGAR
jgi:ubiquinone/menaquinone biosynthesis C-methylase UbiE